MCKFAVPGILAVDLNKSVTDRLLADGFNIENGTFGTNYPVGNYEECGLNGDLPYITEKDIVIVDLNRDESLLATNPIATGKTLLKSHRTTLFIDEGLKYYNPSFIFAKYYKDEFEKVLESGGILIVFASEKKIEQYFTIEIEGSYRSSPKGEIVDNYDWFPFKINPQNCVSGKAVKVDSQNKDMFGSIFQNCLDEITYDCIFPGITTHYTDMVLIRNKIDEVIGFIRVIKLKSNKGYLIVLPQFTDPYKPLSNLFKEFLPVLVPDLFPDFVKNNWINNDEYIFPNIKKLICDKDNLIEEYSKKIEEIDEKIESTKNEFGYMTNILISQGYDEFLVDNVYKVLELIGYTKILKVDDVVEGNRQEDLRITDNGQFTVIEIKGHKGNPTEDDCQALLKYLNRNMKKERRTDIYGILIINHQRLLEPIQRIFPAFSTEQIEDAKRDNYTLVDTWQLFQAARLKQEGLIDFNTIDVGLHTPGLFVAIPSSWSYLGKIDNYYSQSMVVGLILENQELKKNDEIIIQNGNDYFKQTITSLRVNDIDVDSAKKDDAVSFKVNFPITKKANIFIQQRC